ncbi:Flp family type IVb pilin [Pasteurella dagmatis]|nr:Flp family type IVb pilin [Pasteurella dagmatis]
MLLLYKVGVSFKYFFSQCKGITSIEYGLIAAIVAIFIVSVLYGDNALVEAIKGKFELLSSIVKNSLKDS